LTTDEQRRLKNLEFNFDQLQNRLQLLTARVDRLCGEMNGFSVEVKGQLLDLLGAKEVEGENL